MQQLKHGLSRTPEYTAWITMLRRCGHRGNPSAVIGWAHYGGRGIRVCTRWREDFLVFLADVGERPSRNHILGRTDTNRDYEPENTTWILRAEHADLTRRRAGIHFQNQHWTYRALADRYELSSATLRRRLALGWELMTALSKPVRPQNCLP